MKFTTTPEQTDVLDVTASLFAQHAGADRARIVGTAGHDDELLDRLSTGGYLDVALTDGYGPVTAALVAEQASTSLACANLSARLLIAPTLLGENSPDKVALAQHGSIAPVRFGSSCDVLLVVDGDEARAIENPTFTPVESFYGYPFADCDTAGGTSLGPGSGPRLRQWWQTSLAVEAAGLLLGAHHLTVDYLKNRSQFGKPLATLQALQHRLAEAYVLIAGVQWLGRKAAWSNAEPEAAAAAATHAVSTIAATAADFHQLTGAIGFTLEYDLHLYTSRLWALRVELGGIDAHARSLAVARWAPPHNSN